jgi:hypothetical protein
MNKEDEMEFEFELKDKEDSLPHLTVYLNNVIVSKPLSNGKWGAKIYHWKDWVRLIEGKKNPTFDEQALMDALKEARGGDTQGYPS